MPSIHCHCRKLLILSTVLALHACVSRRVTMPPFIPPVGQATVSELVQIVNERQQLTTLHARADLQFETAVSQKEGVFRRYRSAQGRILLARPERILLRIEAPLLGVTIADMASDGRRFQLLIYPEEYRVLIEGTNALRYTAETKNLERDPELVKAGPLVNIRPQHLTEAILLDPIDLADPDTIVLMDEARPVEDDDRAGASKGERVIRSYYVLSVARRGDTASRRKYWFGRTADLPLVRQQLFDSNGLLVGDVRFFDYLPRETAGQRFPGSITIARPYEDYVLRMTFKPDSLVFNRDIPATAFSVEPPPDWAEGVRRIDLDRRSRIQR